MSKPVVFWHSKKLDHIMCPPSPIAPPPAGYERVECVHAHQADMWSRRLRRQEKRLYEMTDEERYNFEEPIRAHMLRELEKNLREAKTETNRVFLAMAIQNIKRKRQQRSKETYETFMHFEAKENVAS
jgi:hypothetical protein